MTISRPVKEDLPQETASPPSEPQPAPTSFTNGRLKLPYRVPKDELPAPLPSLDELESAWRSAAVFLNSSLTILNLGGEHYRITASEDLDSTEAETMVYIRERCGHIINIPKVYAIHVLQGTSRKPEKRDLEGKGSSATITFVVTQKLKPGRLLSTHLPHLLDSELASITRQLTEALKALRQLETPSYCGALGHRSVQKPYRPVDAADDWKYEYWSPPCGVFDSEEQFIEGALLSRFTPQTYWGFDRYAALRNVQRGILRQIWREMAEASLGNYTIVFTQGSVNVRNLSLDDEGRLWFLRWSSAGWFPHYWEYASAMAANMGVSGSKRWFDILRVALPERCDEQCAWMLALEHFPEDKYNASA